MTEEAHEAPMSDEVKNAYSVIAKDILEGMSIDKDDVHLLPEYIARRIKEVNERVEEYIMLEALLSVERAANQYLVSGGD